MPRERVTEEFVRLFREINRVSNGDQNSIKDLVKVDNTVMPIVDRLHQLFVKIEQHRKFSSTKVIHQAHPEFLEAFINYKADLQNTWIDALDIDLDVELGPIESGSLADATGYTSSSYIENFKWEIDAEFDPDDHSAASDLEAIRQYLETKIDDSPFYVRAAKSWDWFENTVGIQFTSIEKRWHEFPIIVVKQSVSDQHGINETRGLFSYLREIRTAYIAGAFLSSLAMCRAATEILFRFHYGTIDERTALGRLIEEISLKHDWIIKENFNERVKEANRLLHASKKFDISNSEEAKQIVWNWILPLQNLIQRAPE